MRLVGWATTVAAIDQLSKLAAASYLHLLVPLPLLDETVRLTLAHNSGGAFSLLRSQGELMTYLVGVLSVGLLATLLLGGKRLRPLVQVGLVLISGGAWGNLIDRLHWGYVIDFIDIGTSSWRWATFNLADSAIVLGTALIVLSLIAREVRTA